MLGAYRIAKVAIYWINSLHQLGLNVKIVKRYVQIIQIPV